MNWSKAILDWILIRCCSNVPLLVPVPFYMPVDRRYHHVMTNIEFSSLIQEGFVKVWLDNESFRVSILMTLLVFNKFLNILQSETNVDAISSVCEFARFDDPNIFSSGSFRWILSFILVGQLLPRIKTG